MYGFVMECIRKYKRAHCERKKSTDLFLVKILFLYSAYIAQRKRDGLICGWNIFSAICTPALPHNSERERLQTKKKPSKKERKRGV